MYMFLDIAAMVTFITLILSTSIFLLQAALLQEGRFLENILTISQRKALSMLVEDE